MCVIQLSAHKPLASFYCSNGDKVPIPYLCDGFPDCDGGEDEGGSGKSEE